MLHDLFFSRELDDPKIFSIFLTVGIHPAGKV
jgi:hypothetical protein